MKILRSKITYIVVAIMSLFAMSALTSCDDSFFENEGDCEVSHKIRFVYDMNLKWADAFPSEVNSVNLYVFDSNGRFVKEYTGRGEAVNQPDYTITLDLPVGDYKFLAWCGLDNNTDKESFTVPEPVVGVTTLEEMSCALNTQKISVYSRSDSQEPIYSNERIYFMYHGYLEASLEDNHDGAEYIYTINLTKDTNHFRIILQELTGADLDPDDYALTIEDTNSVMNWDNSLGRDDLITYEPWSQEVTEAGVGKLISGNELTYVKGLVADMSSSRLMASHKSSTMLTITNRKSGELIARVPVLEYALLSKKYYESAYGHQMTDQEFLDREDEYVMTFFLYNNRWMNAYIDIQQWRIVLQDYELGN